MEFVLVVGRFADSHFMPAKAALEKRIPVYIDKPTTRNYDEVVKLGLLANKKRTKLTSFSPMIMGSDFDAFRKSTLSYKIFSVACPGICCTLQHPKAKDLSFYASHGTDLLTALIPTKPVAVFARKLTSAIYVQVVFEDNYIGNLHLALNTPEFYHIVGMKNDATKMIKLNANGDMYERTIDHLFNIFLKKEWTEDQFTRPRNSMWILDQIKNQVKS